MARKARRQCTGALGEGGQCRVVTAAARRYALVRDPGPLPAEDFEWNSRFRHLLVLFGDGAGAMVFRAEEADPARLKEELADVFYAAFLLADKFGLDVGEIVRDKLKQNGVKYPVHKARGSRKKYDEL